LSSDRAISRCAGSTIRPHESPDVAGGWIRAHPCGFPRTLSYGPADFGIQSDAELLGVLRVACGFGFFALRSH
jgi:hypothetical protein